MSFSVKTEVDGTTLVVRIPMRFQRRGGRKRIVAPNGSEMVPTTKPQPDGTLVKALARAWRWQRMLDEGVHNTVSEVADAEGINRSYVSRILRLVLLAPDIVARILEGELGPRAHAGQAGSAVARELGRAVVHTERANAGDVMPQLLSVTRAQNLPAETAPETRL